MLLLLLLVVVFGVVCTAPVVGMSETPQVCLGLFLNYNRTCLDHV